jgi:hypothetical protein
MHKTLRGKGYSKAMIFNFLIPIINKKVVTERELLKSIRHTKEGVVKLERYYQLAVTDGFPIYRREIDWNRPAPSRKGNRKANIVNRCVIYYLR